VYFNVSELDLLPLVRKYRVDVESPSERGDTVPVYVGLADEKGYPHEGTLDFTDTKVDSSTGTMRVRAIVKNHSGVLLPGLFVRVRVPIDKSPALLVPDVAIMADQGGRYVMVVDDKDVAEQRRITVGQQVDRMRVVEEGLKESDRVIVNGIQRARPGAKVNIVKSDAGSEKETASAQTSSPKK
jgi:RND family efflux transporter MFP subunit